MDEVKCVIIGDGTVGKTCMLSSFANNTFPHEYVPTVFDNFNSNILVDGRAASLGLWDTAGQDSYDRLRPLVYPHTNVFILVFAVNNHNSLRNIREKWVPEVRHHCPNSPIILVCNKVDLRDEDKSPEELAASENSPISKTQGQKMAQAMGATVYEECSALTQVGLKEVFDSAVRIARNPPKPQPKTSGKNFKKMFCLLL